MKIKVQYYTTILYLYIRYEINYFVNQIRDINITLGEFNNMLACTLCGINFDTLVDFEEHIEYHKSIISCPFTFLPGEEHDDCYECGECKVIRQ